MKHCVILQVRIGKYGIQIRSNVSNAKIKEINENVCCGNRFISKGNKMR